MNKKLKMADGVHLWNIRRKTNELPSETLVCKGENIDPDTMEDMRKRLSAMSRHTVKNPLWSEMNTLKSVIYKHHNQHGKEKYFQGIKRIQKHLTRLKEMELEITLTSFIQKLPKKDSKCMATNRYPCAQAIECVLFMFMGAAKIITQTIGHCKSTLKYVGSQLSMGFFVTFHIVIAASLSRFWVLLKDFLYNIIECYDKLYSWLDLVMQDARSSLSDQVLPKCLKTWIMSAELDNTLFNAEKSKPESLTPRTSLVLEKLFSLTPASAQKDDGFTSAMTTSGGISHTDSISSVNHSKESFNASVKSTGSLLDDSEPVSRELFKDVDSYNRVASSNKFVRKRKARQESDLQDFKKLHLDQAMSDIETTSTITTEKNDNLLNNRSYIVFNYPNLKLRCLTSYGMFKMPYLKINKRIKSDYKRFESKRKCKRRKMERISKEKKEQRKKEHFRTYKKKIIFMKTKSNLNKRKRSSKHHGERCQIKWERKIGMIVNRRKIKLSISVANLRNCKSNQCGLKDIYFASNLDPNVSNVQKCRKEKEVKNCHGENIFSSFKQYSGFNALERLANDQDSLPSTRKMVKISDETVGKTKRFSREKESKQLPHLKVNHPIQKDYVDDLFDVLGV